MAKVELTQLIETGAHFGHLTRRWNPKMKPYIFMEKNGIHIIDLKKTQLALEKAVNAFNNIVSQGRTVLFVGTKKQAKSVVASEAKRCEMNWVSERWLGGMLTNFATIRKSIKKLQNIDKMESDGTFEKITKKERLQLTRERDKLRKVLDGVEFMNKIPGAMFIVDIKKEFIAVQEAHRLNIPISAIVDTNCDPDEVDYVIPANDDAVRTIELISKAMADAVIEGSVKAKELKAEQMAEKEKLKKENELHEASNKSKKPRVRRVKFDQKGEKKDIKPIKTKETSETKPVVEKEVTAAVETEAKPVVAEAEAKPATETEAKVEETVAQEKPAEKEEKAVENKAETTTKVNDEVEKNKDK